MTDVEKVGPVDHITRAPLPWRTSVDLTECGKPTAELTGRLLTRDEAAARINRIGRQRAAFTLCMTCATTSDRHQGPAETDAVATVHRAMQSVRHAYPPGLTREQTPQWQERQRLNGELEAIAALIAVHREEFDGYLAGLRQTVSLAERRGQKRTRAGSDTRHPL